MTPPQKSTEVLFPPAPPLLMLLDVGSRPLRGGFCHNLSLQPLPLPQPVTPSCTLISQDSPHLCCCSHLHLISRNQASYISPSSTLNQRQTVVTLMLRSPDLFPGLIARYRQALFLTLSHTPDPRPDSKVSTSFRPVFTRLSESLAIDPAAVLWCRVLSVLRCDHAWYLTPLLSPVAEPVSSTL